MSDRRRQLRLWLLAMDRFELRLRTRAARARNGFLREAAEGYADNGQVPAWLHEHHRRRIAGELSDHYQRVIPYFAGMALKSIKSRSVQRKQAEGIFASLMREWVTREALRKARLIASTDADDVRAAIQDGLEEGLGTAEIARAIRKVSKLTPHRAATVARTETHQAATFAADAAAREAEQELGVRLVKTWLPTLDDRTRPEHLAMKDHPPIPLNEKFMVGGEMMDRPGDPSASPENLVNCRCAYVAEEATE